LLSLALAMSLLVSGCGASGSQPEQGVLDVWTTWADDPTQLQALFDRYGQESGVPVRVTTGVQIDKVSKALAGSTPPDLVILSGSSPIDAYHDQGWVEPLDAWIESVGIDREDLYAAPLAQCETPEGATLCLPWGCDVYALFWNKDLFRAAGLDPERPPQTMEELAEYAARLTVRDEQGEIAQIGFLPDLTRPHTGLYASMLGGSRPDGRTVPAGDAQVTIDAKNWERQFYVPYDETEIKQFVLSFNRYANSNHPEYRGKRLDCGQCHRSAPPKPDKVPERGFTNGKVAMLVGGQWLVGPDHRSRLPTELAVGVAPFPPPAGHPERAHTAVVEGPVVFLPTGAVDKEAAARLLAWTMSPEIVAEQAYANASLPTSRTAAQDPRFQQAAGWALFIELVAHSNPHIVLNPPRDPLGGG
jgi:multiple sugar transport system substrate-binding protein